MCELGMRESRLSVFKEFLYLIAAIIAFVVVVKFMEPKAHNKEETDGPGMAHATGADRHSVPSVSKAWRRK